MSKSKLGADSGRFASLRSLPAFRPCATLPGLKNRGDVAQLGERLVRNEEVGGSIPLISTISPKVLPE